MNGWGLVASFLYIFAVIFTAGLLSVSEQEISRKFIHIMVSNWWFIAMHLFTSVWWAAVVPLCFVVINSISCKKRIFTGMEREGDSSRGTVYYAVSLLLLTFLCFGLLQKPEVGLIGVLALGYGDGFAAIVGKRFPVCPYTVRAFQGLSLRGGTLHILWRETHKTVSGSAVVFFVTFAAVLSVSSAGELSASLCLISLLLAACTTAAEAFCGNGLDNLSVPLLPVLLYWWILL